MTGTEDAMLAGLLAAIINEPESDDLRLIAADWMEDHGQPERSEFVRVQVELARIASLVTDRRDNLNPPLCWSLGRLVYGQDGV